MKNIYLIIAVLLFGFTSCKKTESTDVENSIDTTSVQQDSVDLEVNDTIVVDSLANDTTTVSTATTSAGENSESSDAKLPNKLSTSTSTIKTDPSKGKYSLAETKWRLVELNGKTVDATTRRDYFINFDSKSGTFRAFVGCNRINGKYFMKSEGKIGFTEIVLTKKMCDNIDVERNFFNNLQKVDNYMIEKNGKMMHLHIGKKAAAKFEAIR